MSCVVFYVYTFEEESYGLRLWKGMENKIKCHGHIQKLVEGGLFGLIFFLIKICPILFFPHDVGL